MGRGEPESSWKRPLGEGDMYLRRIGPRHLMDVHAPIVSLSSESAFKFHSASGNVSC